MSYREVHKLDEDHFVEVNVVNEIELSKLQAELAAWQKIATLTTLELRIASTYFNNIGNIDANEKISDLQDLITELEAIE